MCACILSGGVELMCACILSGGVELMLLAVCMHTEWRGGAHATSCVHAY